MAFALKFLVVFLLLSMVTQGLCRCSYGDIQIGTVRTGREMGEQIEWKVTVYNTCNCPQKQVSLSCRGFAPVKPVEPSLLLQPHGATCLLINGAALPAGGTATFTYIGDPYFFKPASSTVAPSCN